MASLSEPTSDVYAPCGRATQCGTQGAQKTRVGLQALSDRSHADAVREAARQPVNRGGPHVLATGVLRRLDGGGQSQREPAA